MEARELLGVAFTLATAVLYGIVGWTVSRRRIEGDAQLASDAFAGWWYALAAITLQGVVQTAIYEGGVRDLAIYLTLLHLALLLVIGAFWGLTYYLVYLFTGSRRWLVPSVAYMIVIYLVLVYWVTARHPEGVEQVGSAVRLTYQMEPNRVFGMALGIALVGPILAGAIAYARLFFRVEEPTQRYRIGLVSGSLTVWFLTLLTGTVVPVGDETLSAQPWWTFVSRGAALLASIAILLAYRPPAWVRERYGIRNIDDPAG